VLGWTALHRDYVLTVLRSLAAHQLPGIAAVVHDPSPTMRGG
jgi:hypothetical protein